MNVSERVSAAGRGFSLQQDKHEGRTCYFVRTNPKGIQEKSLESDMIAGTVTTNALEAYKTLLMDLYLPILESQEKWGKCQEDQHTEFLMGATKFANTLAEAVSSLDGGARVFFFGFVFSAIRRRQWAKASCSLSHVRLVFLGCPGADVLDIVV